MAQPQVTTAQGCILTVGIVGQSDRCTIVLPVFTDATTFTDVDRCKDAVDSFEDQCLSDLCDLLSEEVYVTFTQAEGMQDGMVPNRIDYDFSTHPGTRTGGFLPMSVAALIAFYSDPDDIVVNERIRVGKQFIPGISEDDVELGAVSLTLTGLMLTWAQKLLNGYASLASPSDKWYRACSAPFPRIAESAIIRTGAVVVRGYTGTQRRRLVPH